MYLIGTHTKGQGTPRRDDDEWEELQEKKIINLEKNTMRKNNKRIYM